MKKKRRHTREKNSMRGTGNACTVIRNCTTVTNQTKKMIDQSNINAGKKERN